MRLLLQAALAASVLFANQALAEENVSLELTLNSMKVGWNTAANKPADGTAVTQKETYIDTLGASASEDSTAFLEFGLHYGKTSLYVYPLAARGEREIWAGYQVGEGLEAGLAFGGFQRKYSPGRADSSSKLTSEFGGKVGLFAIYGFKLLEQDFELTAVPFITSGARKFEDSTTDAVNSGYGANLEVLHFLEVTKNLNIGFGLSYDYSKTVSKIDGKETETNTTTDIGLQLGRINYSF